MLQLHHSNLHVKDVIFLNVKENRYRYIARMFNKKRKQSSFKSTLPNVTNMFLA